MMGTSYSQQTEREGLSGNKLLWLAPAAAAFAYPYFVTALYESGQRISHATDAASATVAWMSLLVSIVLSYGVPALGLVTSYVLGRVQSTTRAKVRARRFALLAFASPSLFVFLGTVFYMLKSSTGDFLFWAALWLAVIAIIALSNRSYDVPVVATAAPAWLRRWHGLSALAIVLIFLAWHLLNHMTALWSLDVNWEMMKALRKWYRSGIVQPILVALFLFQVTSGLTLFRYRTNAKADFARTLQTATGALLAAFILSHLTAVFILGRVYAEVDTNFRWAAGAPTGLLPDPWNVRLIPHYSLIPWIVITHLGLGLRVVLLSRNVSPVWANRVFGWISAFGAAASVIIIAALMSVHGKS